jgi:hypothetical protein
VVRGRGEQQRHPGDGERANQNQQDGQDAERVPGDPHRPHECPAAPLQGGRRRLVTDETLRRAGATALAQSEVERLGHRGEAEATLPHQRQVPLQRRDGLGAVPAGVVHQHHAAVRPGPRGVGDHPRHAGPLPIPAVHVGEHVQVPGAAGVLDDRPVVVVDGRRGGGVREPDQRRPHAGSAGDGELRLAVLPFSSPAGQRGEIRVGERVRAQLVAVGPEPPHQVGALRDPLAYHEEGGPHAVSAEHVGDARRPYRIGAVVEGQADGA